MSNIFNKRISKELEKCSNYGIFNIKSDYNEYGNKITIITFEDYNLKIECCQNYPFKAPNIKLNGKNYCDVINDTQKKYSEQINNLNVECLCCFTVAHAEKWKPCFTIKNILDEYLKFKVYIDKIAYR